MEMRNPEKMDYFFHSIVTVIINQFDPLFFIERKKGTQWSLLIQKTQRINIHTVIVYYPVDSDCRGSKAIVCYYQYRAIKTHGCRLFLA